MNRAEKVAVGLAGLWMVGAVVVLDAMLSLVFALLQVIVGTAAVLAFVGLGVAGTVSIRKRAAFLDRHATSERATRELDKARFTALTHLTPADERWLAERHFWTPPPEVPRLRAGRPYDQPWDWLTETRHSFSGSRMPSEMLRRQDMQRLAEKSRAIFEGVNLTGSGDEPARTKPVEGDVVARSSHAGNALGEALVRADLMREAAQVRRELRKYGFK